VAKISRCQIPIISSSTLSLSYVIPSSSTALLQPPKAVIFKLHSVKNK